MDFTQFKLHDSILRRIKAAGHSKPTPIQTQASDRPSGPRCHGPRPDRHRKDGRPCYADPQPTDRVSTGTGARPRHRRHARAGKQIQTDIKRLARFTRLRSATVYGGVGLTPQAEKLRAKVDIVGAYPGSLQWYLTLAGPGESSDIFEIVRPIW